MRVIENLNQLNAGFSLTEAECKEGVILKFAEDAFDNYNGVLVVRISRRYAEDENAPKTTEAENEPERTIPGHPNCHYGDCYNCHVVSCGIYQGYEEIPVP